MVYKSLKLARNKIAKNLMSLFFAIILISITCHTLSAQHIDEVQTMNLVVHFIDVGVGDAIFIELPNPDHEVLIDGGHRKMGLNFLDYIRNDLDDPIELAVITHPDYDHWSGFDRLLGRYTINILWDPGYDRDCKFTGSRAAKKKDKDTYLRFIERLENKGIPGRPIKPDIKKPKFTLDDVKFWVLHADSNPSGPDCPYIINNSSVVIRMQYKDVVFLFIEDANGKDRKNFGDVQPKYVEAKLLALEEKHPKILRAHVLKIPHHSSETANTNRFICAVAPRFAVIYSSSTSQYNLPKSKVVRRYQRLRFDNNRKIEKVFRTNYGENSYENHKYGNDHVICGTNGDPADIVCDYIWNFSQD